MSKRDQAYLYSQVPQIRSRLPIDMTTTQRVVSSSKMAKDQFARLLWHTHKNRVASLISPYSDERLGKMVTGGRPIEDDMVTPLALVLDTGEITTSWSGRYLLVTLAAAAIVAVLTDILWAEMQKEAQPEPESGARLKCRFCSQTFAKVSKGKGGKNVSGFDVLMKHISDKHPDKEAAIVGFAYDGPAQSIEDYVAELDALSPEEIKERHRATS